MTMYNVHLYREMRIKFTDIEAETPEEAVKLAEKLDLYQAQEVEDGEGRNFATLVDVVGDEEHEHSKWLNQEYGSLLDYAPQLLAALEDAIFNEEGNYDGPDEEPEWMTFARQAIAQAKGIKS